ncbi:MAG: MFS transporter [Deltaproteobacteria bacterium]|nr:MFS transporter [Deltaproteobacteria bacterium]
MSPTAPPPYRFVIVAAVASASFLGNFVIFQMAGLAPRIMELAHLSGNQFGMIVGIALLTAAVLGLPLGALGDKAGVKPVAAAAIGVTFIGCLGRYFAEPTLSSYLFWMFLIGAANAALNANFIKILGVWLPPSGIGVGVGLYLTGIGLGQAVAIASGPRFDSLSDAYLFSVILAAVVGVLWVLLIKNPPGLPERRPQPMMESLKFVAGKKDVWLGGVGMFLMLGSYVCLTSFAAQFLTDELGVPEKNASVCASLIAAFMLLGALSAARLARLVGRSKIFLLLTGLASCLGTILAARTNFGPHTPALLSLAGFGVGVFSSFVLSLPMLLSYIGEKNAGSAGGLISSLQSAGGFLLPMLFPVLAGEALPTLMVWIAAAFALMGLSGLALPELVRKGTERDQSEDAR